MSSNIHLLKTPCRNPSWCVVPRVLLGLHHLLEKPLLTQTSRCRSLHRSHTTAMKSKSPKESFSSGKSSIALTRASVDFSQGPTSLARNRTFPRFDDRPQTRHFSRSNRRGSHSPII